MSGEESKSSNHEALIDSVRMSRMNIILNINIKNNITNIDIHITVSIIIINGIWGSGELPKLRPWQAGVRYASRCNSLS